MGSSSSKPKYRPYPLVTPGYNVPYGQPANLYLPPQLLPQNYNARPEKKNSRRKSKRSGYSQEITRAYMDGLLAARMMPQATQQPVSISQPHPENIRPVVVPEPVRATPLFTPGGGAQLTAFPSPQVAPTQRTQTPRTQTPRTQTPFAPGTYRAPSTVQQHQEPPVQPQHQFAREPQAPLQQQQRRFNPDISRVLEPLPPANPAVFGPPPSQHPQQPLTNPLPTPPRDLYELSPYNTLLNLPQTTALLTAAYSQQQQQGALPQSYGRRRGSRAGGLLRALTGRGRKEEDVHFVPVFINGQPGVPPAQTFNQAGLQQAGLPLPGAMPVPFAGANPAAAPPPPVVQQDPVQSSAPQFPVPEPATAAPVRFSGTSHVAFLNYSPHHIIYNGAEYPSAMHLHEALKFLPHNPGFAERIRNCPDVAGVHPLSEELARSSPNAVRPDWAAVYLPLMQEVILQKFKLHADLRAMLLETGDAPLIYADQLDSFWGEGPAGNGHNNLGHILEQVRASLRVEGGLS